MVARALSLGAIAIAVAVAIACLVGCPSFAGFDTGAVDASTSEASGRAPDAGDAAHAADAADARATADGATFASPFMLGVTIAGGEFGTNVPGTYGTDYVYPTDAELAYYASKGLTLVRMTFLWERVQPNFSVSVDDTNVEIGRIKNVVQLAANHGMKVILDEHGKGRYFGQIVGAPGSSATADLFAAFWTGMASVFGKMSNIYGYELMADPHDMPAPSPSPTVVDAAIRGIRKVDMQTPILVDGDNWSAAQSWTAFWPGSGNPPSDPANRLVFAASNFFDRGGTGMYMPEDYDAAGATAGTGVTYVTPFLDWLRAYGAQGLVSEYGIPYDPAAGPADLDSGWFQTMDVFLANVTQDCISSIYWAGGSMWGTYPLSIEPVNGVDQPQMAIVSRYARADAGCKGP